MDTTSDHLAPYWSVRGFPIWALSILAIVIIPIIIRLISSKKHYSSSMDTTSSQSTEPYCTSSSPSSPSWNVFLSFYGDDTRRNFTSHLYSALVQAGIQVFRDDPALEKGEVISSGLLSAIRDSKMFVVVLSENYARSPWCLDELVEILKCKRSENQIIPVFYYVDPSVVRNYKGSFGEALNYHKKFNPVDAVEKWKSALAELSGVAGYHLKKNANEKESDIVREIVEKVSRQAYTEVLDQEECLIGIESAVEEIFQKLRMESSAVHAIGICGMDGIGKTTIAKAFYNNYLDKFDISCFIENVKLDPRGSPFLGFLEQLLKKLLRIKDYKIPDAESGIKQLKKILRSKKALVVMDDLDQSSYSELLVRLCHLFSAGSRIIITTNDVNLLNKLKLDISEVDIYMVKELGLQDSLKLFSHHAFRKTMPPEKFRELSVMFLNYVGGLPLAIKVLGSSLCGRTDVSFWQAKLEKVRRNPHIHKILKLSYDELGDETVQKIFLDIVFFYIGKNKDNAFDVFKSCDFYPEVGIPRLVERCLLTIDRDNKFQMHNLIQDKGKEVIEKESKDGKRRLYLCQGNNACEALQNLEGAEKIEGLVLDLTISSKKYLSAKIFEKMPNLRLLGITSAHDFGGNFKNKFPELRCIRWAHCPWMRLPSDFCPEKLVHLDMPSSKLKILWKSLKSVKQLTNLRCLDIHGCLSLKRLPEQLGDLKSLKILNASHTPIEQLPDSIAHLKELVELNLDGCKKLRKLPQKLGYLKVLKKLIVRHTAIERLPDSIAFLKELVDLDLFRCEKLKKLPEEFGKMESLKILNANGSGIEQLPDSLGDLINLVNLQLCSCQNLISLPSSIWKLKFLKKLYLHRCSKLEQLPEEMGKMESLEVLDASYTAIEQLPDSIGLLSRLEKLDASNTAIVELPDSIGLLSRLVELDASNTAIVELPDSIGLLSRLENLDLRSCEKLKYLPNSIGNLTSVRSLLLNENDILRNLPNAVKNMNKLENLTLSCNIRIWLPLILSFSSLTMLHLTNEGQSVYTSKGFSLYDLSNLEYLTLENFTSPGSSFPELPPNLKRLILSDDASLEQLPDLSSLKHLYRLDINRCINLQSLSLLPLHLQILDILGCTSLQSISLLPPHLISLRAVECTSLQDLPDLSMFKDLNELRFIWCSSLKLITMKQSSLQTTRYWYPFKATVPNREIPEWFSYESIGCTVSFDFPTNLEDKFLGVALWVVYKCKQALYGTYIRAVITNKTQAISNNYEYKIHDRVEELHSKVECIMAKDISVKSGDKIKVSFQKFLYDSDEDSFQDEKVPVEQVHIEMCGVHILQ